jgi:hypothetical protein
MGLPHCLYSNQIRGSSAVRPSRHLRPHLGQC